MAEAYDILRHGVYLHLSDKPFGWCWGWVMAT